MKNCSKYKVLLAIVCGILLGVMSRYLQLPKSFEEALIRENHEIQMVHKEVVLNDKIRLMIYEKYVDQISCDIVEKRFMSYRIYHIDETFSNEMNEYNRDIVGHRLKDGSWIWYGVLNNDKVKSITYGGEEGQIIHVNGQRVLYLYTIEDSSKDLCFYDKDKNRIEYYQ